jgi:hypothetical protein
MNRNARIDIILLMRLDIDSEINKEEYNINSRGLKI